MDRSIKHLREINLPRDKFFNIDLYMRYVAKPISVYLLKILSYTPITANQVSLSMIFLSIVPFILIVKGGYWYPLFGCIFLQFLLQLDCVDGSLARLRNSTSLYGIYLDALFHDFIMPLLFFALGINAYKYSGSFVFVYAGFMIAFFMSITSLARFEKYNILIYHSKDGIRSKNKESMFYIQNHRKKLVGRFIEFFNQFSHIFTIFLIFSIFNILPYLILFYAPFYLLIGIVKFYLELKQGLSV